MYLEVPTPDEAAELAAWWRQAFQAPAEHVSDTGEQESPRPQVVTCVASRCDEASADQDWDQIQKT